MNISSIAGVKPSALMPVYSATKFAIHGLTLSWGLPEHFNRTKIRVVGICPGVTMTDLIKESNNRNLGPDYNKLSNAIYATPGQQ